MKDEVIAEKNNTVINACWITVDKLYFHQYVKVRLEEAYNNLANLTNAHMYKMPTGVPFFSITETFMKNRVN